MDLFLIPLALTIGGTLIYFGINGLPQTQLDRIQLRPAGKPFNLGVWLSARTVAPRPETPGQVIGPNPRDTELVDLMNEMIAVREELTQIRGAQARRSAKAAGRRRATTTTVAPAARTATIRQTPRTAASRPVSRRLRNMASAGNSSQA